MDRAISFTPEAETQLLKLIYELEQKYSIRFADKFSDDLDSLLDLVAKNPEMFKATSRNKNIRVGLAHKNVSFHYQILPKSIRVLNFKFNRSR